MPSRNLETNQNKSAKALEDIEKQAQRSIAKDYKISLDLIRAELLKRIEKYGKLTNAKLSKFDRREKLNADVTDILTDMITKVNSKIRRNSDIQTKQSFFRYAWTIDTNLGVEFKWAIKKGSFEQ